MPRHTALGWVTPGTQTHHSPGSTRAWPAPGAPRAPGERAVEEIQDTLDATSLLAAGSTSRGHKAGSLLWTILTAALFGSRAQNASSTEQAPCLLGASRHPICTEASHPAALPEQGWIITTPKRISRGHHLQRIISLVAYADCSWPSAQGYTPQDCYIQSYSPVGLWGTL